MTRHLLTVEDLSREELRDVLARAEDPDPPRVLDGAGVALVFAKPSLRTRSSCEMAVVGLGGHPVTISADEVGIDEREIAEDVARTLAGYHRLIAARVFAHSTLERMAAVSPVPIVNLLSDDAHPLQALADLLTIRQVHGQFEGVTLAYVGDANNVARSLLVAGAMVGLRVRVACPPGHAPDPVVVDLARSLGGDVDVVHRAGDAVKGADVVYTDVWTSMGQEAEADRRRRDFEGFSVDEALFESAAEGAVFMHCLPAHRGEEVSAGVADGERSVIWRQAENRMHAARAAFWWLHQAGQIR